LLRFGYRVQQERLLAQTISVFLSRAVSGIGRARMTLRGFSSMVILAGDSIERRASRAGRCQSIGRGVPIICASAEWALPPNRVGESA
jgi:hypothetical protein